MKRRDDSGTLELFGDVAPRPVVARYDEQLVHAGNQRGRLARAVAAALRNHNADRAGIATEMSAYLGERVSEGMLNRYASQGAEDHAMPAHRLVALAVITGDARLINALLGDTGLVAVEAKYEPLIRREMLREVKASLENELAAADAAWRAKR
jgi:hypothetical protein